MWWNCGPGGIVTNLQALLDLTTTHKPEIIHLQDVKISKENAPKIQKQLSSLLPSYTTYTNSKSKTEQAASHHSVLSLIHKGLTTNLKIITSSSPQTAGRLLMFQLLGAQAERPLRTANVYFPTSGDNSPSRSALEEELLSFHTTSALHNCRTTIAGDFNASHHPAHRQGYSPSLSITNIDKQHLRFLSRTKLHDASLRSTYADTHTWYSHDLHKSAKLDHLLTDDPSTATLSTIAEPPLSTTDHLFSLATLHPDLGTTHPLPPPPTRTPTINLANRQTLSSLWSSELERALNTMQLPPNPNDRLHTAQLTAVSLAERIYGYTSTKRNKPFASAHLKSLSRQLALVRSLRRHLWSIHAAGPQSTHQRNHLLSFLTSIHTPKLADNLSLPNINPLHDSPALIKHHLETLHHTRTSLTRVKHNTIQNMHKTRTEQITRHLRKQLFTPGTRAIQRATGKPQANTHMQTLHSNHPNTITLSRTQPPLTDISLHLKKYCHSRKGHTLTTNSTDCRITVLTHTDLHPLITHCTTQLWTISSIHDSHTDPGSHKTPETENSNILSSLEHELATNGRDKATLCNVCLNHKQGIPTTHNLQTISSSNPDTPNPRQVHTYCHNCNLIVDTHIPQDAYSILPFPEHIISKAAIPASANETLRTEVTPDQVRDVIHSFKTRKAPGSDKMHPELWKDAPPSLINILTDTINQALKTAKIPNAWRGGTIRFLLKKQPDTEFRNWRPVVLLQLAYKAYTKIINERLLSIAERHHLLSPSQEGFRSRHSVQRQVARLTTLIAQARNSRSTVFLTLADFSNAFNSAPHACIIRILSLLNIPDLDIIKDLLDQASFRSVNNIGTTADIPLTKGIKQGGVESPLIFCLFAEALLRALDDVNHRPNRPSGLISEAAGYADDLAALSIHPSHKTARTNHSELHSRLNSYSQWADIQFNIAKCVITAADFSRPGTIIRTDVLTLAGHRIPNLPPTKAAPYLGALISLAGDFKQEKLAVLHKTRTTILHLRNTVYTREQVERLFRMCVIPLFTFTAGLVNWSPTELKKINNAWSTARKHAFKLPIQTSSAPFLAHPDDGGLDFEPAEWHLLKAQHNVLEQVLSLTDPLRDLIICDTKAALRTMGVYTLAEAQSELKIRPSRTLCNSNLVLRHLVTLSKIGDSIQTTIFDLPLPTTPHISQLLRPARIAARPHRHILAQQPASWLTAELHKRHWSAGISSLIKHHSTELSHFTSYDNKRLRDWNHLSPQTKKAITRTQYGALRPLLQTLPKHSPTHHHPTQHPITKYTNTHTTAPTPPPHPQLKILPRHWYPRKPRTIPTLPTAQPPPRLLIQPPLHQDRPIGQTRILDAFPLSYSLHRATISELNPSYTPPCHTPLRAAISPITFDYTNDETQSLQVRPGHNTTYWNVTLKAGTTELSHKETTATPHIAKGILRLRPTVTYRSRAKIDNSILHVYLARLQTTIAQLPDLEQLADDINTSQSASRLLHWNFTSELQRRTAASHISGIPPILADPSLTHTDHDDSTPTLTVTYHLHTAHITPPKTDTIFLIPAPHNKLPYLNSLHRYGYTYTPIPRHTAIEIRHDISLTSDFTPLRSLTQWTIIHHHRHAQQISDALTFATSHKPLQHFHTLHWQAFHLHSQYGPHTHTPAILAATDGSFDPHDTPPKMGGGIAYRPGDGRNKALGILGAPSSFGAEAGAVDALLWDTPLDDSLIILTDSRSLMQRLQHLTKHPHRTLDKHDHKAILERLLDRILRRTAPTHFVKIKSHKGAILNEHADALAEAGKQLPPEGPTPHNPTLIHHTHKTAQGWTDYSSKHTTYTNWLRKTQSLLLPPLLHADTTTIQFMTRPNCARKHFRAAVYQSHPEFTDTDAKRLLQAYTGTFPTNHKLWLMGRHPTGECPHCPGTMEHMAHWQCTCPKYHDSRSAAHNMIALDFYSHLKRHCSSRWSITLETPMHATSFVTADPYRQWQPDAIATNHHNKQALLLELTRCSDGRHDTSLQAAERKELKYQSLLDDLTIRNNKWTFGLHTTAIGYLTTTNETQLQNLYDTLGVPPDQQDNITRHLILTTAVAFSKMARERYASLQTATQTNLGTAAPARTSTITKTPTHRKHTRKRPNPH
jgi:exonuclease III/ribonuclease HI